MHLLYLCIITFWILSVGRKLCWFYFVRKYSKLFTSYTLKEHYSSPVLFGNLNNFIFQIKSVVYNVLRSVFITDLRVTIQSAKLTFVSLLRKKPTLAGAFTVIFSGFYSPCNFVFIFSSCKDSYRILTIDWLFFSLSQNLSVTNMRGFCPSLYYAFKPVPIRSA